MIQYDTKNYRARNNSMLSAPVHLSVAIIMIVILLVYLGDLDFAYFCIIVENIWAAAEYITTNTDNK